MKFLDGIRIGEYELNVDGFIDEVREKCINGRKNYTNVRKKRRLFYVRGVEGG